MKLPDLLSGNSYEVAPRLLGSILVHEYQGVRVSGKIVETESYDQTDAASHSYKGRTPRTDVMFGPPGKAYVYFTYGMHYCFNIVVGKAGHGSAVLIRAVEPTEGISKMKANRGIDNLENLTNGPAKLCQAFAIDKSFNGHDLSTSPLWIQPEPELPASQVLATTRIGISKDTHRLWRFYVSGNKFVSNVPKV